MSDRPDRCALCDRPTDRLTRHHLIPRTRHHNKNNKKLFDRGQVRAVAWLCRACHDQIHALFDEKTLEREYNTLEKLAAHPDMARFLQWVRTQPPERKVKVRRSGRRR